MEEKEAWRRVIQQKGKTSTHDIDFNVICTIMNRNCNPGAALDCEMSNAKDCILCFAIYSM